MNFVDMKRDLFSGDLFKETKGILNYSENDFTFMPFSVLDTRQKKWKERRAYWKSLGIGGISGRQETKTRLGYLNDMLKKTNTVKIPVDRSAVSTFDPVLCKLVYKWFCPPNGIIIDPFAGGETRGIVASVMGRRYLGIDIRHEQIMSNRQYAENILINKEKPVWIEGDSREILKRIRDRADLIFTCPPYHNLEVYSDLEGDLSNMKWEDFVEAYRQVIMNIARLMKDGAYCVFVVGEIRGSSGSYRGFVPLTIKLLIDQGLEYVSEGIYYMPEVQAAIRTNVCLKNMRFAKNHQNILVFKNNIKKKIHKHKIIL